MVHAFADFFSPVLNVAKGSQSVPLTFRLTDANGVPITDLPSVTAGRILTAWESAATQT